MSSQVQDAPAASGARSTFAAWPLALQTLVVSLGVGVVNLVVFAIARAAGGSMVMSVPDPSEVTALIVLVASIVPIALAGLVTDLIARRAPRVRRWFAWAGLVVAVVSLAPAFGAPDVATGVGLAIMHLVVGPAWFFTVRPRRSDAA